MGKLQPERTTPGHLGKGGAALACLLLGTCLAPSAPAQQAPPAATTKLGTMVVTPLQTNAPNAATRATKIKRSSLKFQMQTGTPVQRATPQHTPVMRTPPQPLHITTPSYPSAAAAQGLRGSVTVGFTIEPDGRTADIHILSATPRDVFDQAAREAARQWRFRPATVNGKPVAKAIRETIVFNPPVQKKTLPAPPPVPKPAQAQEEAPPQQTSTKPAQPKLHAIHVVAPQYPHKAYRQGVGGEVTVQFIVGPDGRPRHIRVIQAKPRVIFNEATKQAVRKWRFRPIATPVKTTQTIHFTPPD